MLNFGNCVNFFAAVVACVAWHRAWVVSEAFHRLSGENRELRKRARNVDERLRRVETLRDAVHVPSEN